MNKFKNLIKVTQYSLVLMLTSLLLSPAVLAEPTDMAGGLNSTFETLFDIARTLVSGITGILSIVMVFIFTWKAFQFARTGDNPSERAKAINGMIFFFIGAACFGAASIITGVFSGMLTGI